MKLTLNHRLNLVLVLSFLLPGIGLGQIPPERSVQAMNIYLPIVMNQPLGMAYVSAGEFMMGCTQNLCFFGSGYVHNIYLNAYFIDIYEITNAQYAECVVDGACTPPGAFGSHTRSSYYDNPTYANYPVIHINWEDAQNYCLWAGKRLPTEAEWEKAAQGGRNTSIDIFPWGDDEPVCTPGEPNGAHYDTCSPADTIQIGSFGPNNYGLYDMAGNVWEFVYDWYDLSYYSNSPYYNPQGPDSGTYKVIRGGSWNYNWTGLRVYDRNFRDPNTAIGNHDVGFRCVYSPLPK